MAFHQTQTEISNINNELKSPNLDFSSLRSALEDVTRNTVCKNRSNLTKEDSLVFLSALAKLTSHYNGQRSQHKIPIIQCLTELFRSLRNSCVDCPQNQDYVSESPQYFVCVADLVGKLPLEDDGSREEMTILYRCLVQFLGNCVTQHERNQKLVLEHVFPMFRLLLEFGDDKLASFTCMVIHNCLMGCCPIQKDTCLDSTAMIGVLVAVIRNSAVGGSEFSLFVMDDILHLPSTIIFKVLEQLSPVEKQLVTEVLIDKLKTVQNSDIDTNMAPSLESLCCIATDFKDMSKDILLVTEHHDSDTQIGHLIVKQLEALGMASGLQDLYGLLKEDKDLLTFSLHLLHAIHKLGKAGNNTFAAVTKVTERDKVDPSHPVYGLKRDLIKLIGNMVYQHRANQDMVREMDGIALILDQTNIDGRNPFITQWAVLAIRNLCDNNQENKAVLASMKMEGLDRNASILEEMGINAEVRGDKVYVKPSEK